MADVIIAKPAVPHFEWAEAALDAMLRRVMNDVAPPAPLTIIEWAEKYRILSKEESNDFPGKYSLEQTPVLRGILASCGDRNVRRVVVQKSAQLGYTAGVVCNVIGYHVHWAPCVMVTMFPREQSAKDFDAEKFSPMVKATPELAERIKLKSRSDGNSQTRKAFPGGRLKLVASKSPSDVKSTTAKVIIVEEPDDTDKNVRGQGDSMALLRNRKKTVNESIFLVGGSPTAKGVSKIEGEMRTTDQRRFMVACHSCGESHELAWENVIIPGAALTDDELKAPDIDERYPLRDVYGRARHEDAFYACPHCGTTWSDVDRCENIRRAARQAPLYGWEPTAPGADPGFFCTELQSVFEGSYVAILAERFLVADHDLRNGDPEKMIDFWNGTLGRVWEYRGELPKEEALRLRAEPYLEWTCPMPGLIALMTVDVQHDRLAVAVWCVGRGEEMFLAYWGELYGQTMVPHQGAWIELEQYMAKRVRHASGASMAIASVAIDCSDGQTSDASYAFVRKHHRQNARQVLAVKGAPDSTGRYEIWTTPKALDPNRKATKATRAGVRVHTVGTAKAKDLILGIAQNTGRIRLEGEGTNRMHWYRNVRDDFYEQMLSEIKIPGRINKSIKEWTKLADRNNEALDCTVYAVWLCRHLRLHLKKPIDWEVMERNLRQTSLLDQVPEPLVPAADGVHIPQSQVQPAAVHTVHEPAAIAPEPAAPAAPAAEPVGQVVQPIAPAAPAKRSASSLASAEWSRRL